MISDKSIQLLCRTLVKLEKSKFFHSISEQGKDSKAALKYLNWAKDELEDMEEILIKETYGSPECPKASS